MKLTDLVKEQSDEYDRDGQYDREDRVSRLILSAFQKCGIEVAETDRSGVKVGYTTYDILYSEGDDDFEATVDAEEATVGGIAKLNESGLFEGECSIMGSSRNTIRFTFKVNTHLRSGTAKID